MSVVVCVELRVVLCCLARRHTLKVVDEQFNHPPPVKHGDNEKSKLPQRAADAQRPKKKPEGEPPVE
ncbi:hypothetical protein OKW34_001954 [Paraburkholderia youngii]|uniref:hypothetical protein n=1 Tax=Paraburkholderia youngii TaxID=2782701 RepID=UPI003D1C95D5